MQAAEAWNWRWPDALKTSKNFSYWERWPHRSGRAPSLEVLERLAKLYACSVSDLLEGHGDYRHLNPHQPTSQQDTPPAPKAMELELPSGMGALARHLQTAVLDALTTTLATPTNGRVPA